MSPRMDYARKYLSYGYLKFSKMDGSNFSLDSFHDLTCSDEREVISLECWQDVPLSKIWIPKRLLPNRMKPSDSRKTQGIFHTLEKKGHSKCIESFSVYSDSDSENEEIFLSSDSNDSFHGLNKAPNKIEDIDAQINSSVFIGGNAFPQDKEHCESAECAVNEFINQNHKEQSFENLEKGNLFKLRALPSVSNLCDNIDEHSANSNSSSTNALINRQTQHLNDDSSFKNFVDIDEVGSSNKDCTVDSYNSLHNILDETIETPMSDFKRDFNLETSYLKVHGEEIDTEKKKNSKKDKKKKKVQKSVTLDMFLEDYTDERKQDDYCNDYLQKVLIEKAKGSGNQLRSVVEFPNLKSESIEYCHSKKLETKSADLTFKTAAKILAESQAISETISNVANDDVSLTTEENLNSDHEILIENVPSEVSRDDIFSLLCGYGEIKNISLNPDGEFHLVFVVMSLSGDMDIDWIIECLNGTEPFGVSSKPLKCQKLP